jgi:hypothetical protein
MSSAMTKNEALRQLSSYLRRPDLDDLTFCKLLNVFAKLSGWFNDTTPPSPEKPVVTGPTPLQMVLAAERKRREGSK